MFCVVELESRRVICHPDGGRKVFTSESFAREYAAALQLEYPKLVFNITSSVDARIDSLGRLLCVYGDIHKLQVNRNA